MGKALALETPIATPAGWTTMGEIEVGDEVFDELGRVCLVDHVSPVYTDHDCYELTFDDGSVIVADGGHQWRVSSARRPKVVTTAEMAAAGVAGRSGLRWHVPLAASLDLPEAALPVDPYVLGCWLGGEQSAKANKAVRAIAKKDRAHFSWEFQRAGYCLENPVTLPWGAGQRIPAPYLRGSFKQRLALIQGIMDGGGRVRPGGAVDLCLLNREVLEQTRELVCSLGHNPGPICKHTVRLKGGGSAKGRRFSWFPLDPVFRLSRKADRLALGMAGGLAETSGVRSLVSIRPVPPVAVRCIQVGSPSHLYLAGRSMIPTHNSALALSIAQHVAAVDHKAVIIFSLEMSKMELVQRLMCSEARVDSNRLRRGALQDSDWPKLSLALGRLAEAPIFIDDTPNATIMEMRAKCRRVASKGGLGLVIIDYLQLMAPLRRTDNRVQEVSEISRSLKILARELDVPVIALSQLSRNVEYRADKRPLLADLRESGCMPASTRVLRADNGEEVTLGELVLTQSQPMVWSIDDRQRIVPAKLVRAFPSGIKPVFTMRLASGRHVDASANHPFLTINGWERLDALTVGSFVATPRVLPPPLNAGQGWRDDELVLLAHLLGDGSMGPGFKYATADPANRAVVEDVARRLFGLEVKGHKLGNTWQLWFPSPYRLTHGRHHPMWNWLEPHGLAGSRAWTKFIPPSVFGCADTQLSLFLRHLWATDGSITISRNGRGGTVTTYYATTSHRLALDVQRLLLRLGIKSAIGTSKKMRTGVPVDGVQFYRDAYSVRIQGAASQARFLRNVGCHGKRGECIPAALEILDAIKENPNVDLVPWPVAQKVKAAAVASSVTHRQIAVALGEAYGGSYLLGSETRPRRFSRDRLLRIAAIVDSPELTDIATSDLYWDEVVEITAIGEQPTFDLTIEGSHNFIANGIVAHNSIEQDADVVMFIYRDEVYHPDSPQRGIAEIHISKHRSGPIGKVELTFLEHYTKFANLARGM